MPSEPEPELEAGYVTLENGGVGVTPQTRRLIIFVLGGIAALAIIAEALLLILGETTSEALLTVAATAVGGVAGLAVPGRDSG